MTDPALRQGGLDERHHERPPLYRNAAVLKWVAQVIALALVVGALFFFVSQAGDNLRATNIAVDFDFLSVDPGIKLSDGIDTNPNTGGRALWVGMVNTLRMAAAGILIATILGMLIGLARLSGNWVLRKLGTVYVETLRNIPLLVQIFLIAAALNALPSAVLNQGPIHGWLHLSNKGLSVPRVYVSEGFYQWAVLMIVGAFVALWIKRLKVAAHDRTGDDTYPWLWALAVFSAVGVVAWFIHPITGWLGPMFNAASDFVGDIPVSVVQLVLSALAVAFAYGRVKRFIASRRTGAGSIMHLSDDDWFRMIFAAAGAIVTIVVIFVVWPGLASWTVNAVSDVLGVLADKFGDGRTGKPIDINRPDIEQLGRFPNYGPAGLNFTVGFAAVFFGVVLYAAAFIAEIVRGGVLAVPKGQIEAARALGLRRSTALRRVILPQAFRVILPPLGNQYLNLTKNTSLAIAVGYSDLVQVGQTVYNQTGRTLPVVAIWMLFYLACSLTISVIVNWFNIRLKIVER